MFIQKLFFIGLVSSVLCGYNASFCSKVSSPTIKKQDILNRQKLTKAIKDDLYIIFVLEMAILRKDWKKMACGNEKLEEDLKVLYQSFNKSIEHARQQLEEFCKAWQLDIKIGFYE